MKLIIAGATGFVGGELVKQSLRRRDVTSVVALARKPVSAPEGVDSSKLKSVVVEDHGDYPDSVKKEFAGADACIWTVAITPSKSKSYPFEEVRRVCQTATVSGLEAMHSAGPAKPFRFLYVSGIAAERDQTKTPPFFPEYSLMRGETENRVLAFGKDHDDIEVCAAKPGLITGRAGVVGSIVGAAANLASAAIPSIPVEDLAAAMIDQVIRGFTKEPLLNDDLCQIGKEVLKAKAEQ